MLSHTQFNLQFTDCCCVVPAMPPPGQEETQERKSRTLKQEVKINFLISLLLKLSLFALL